MNAYWYISNIYPTKAGVLLGSVLGSTLFNIFCYDISNSKECQITRYAYDTAIITQNKNFEYLITDLQNSVDHIS